MQGIRVVQKFRIKKHKSTVIGVAWFENTIYICNENRRIYMVADKALFNEKMREIRFNDVIDPTDMVVCKVNRMYVRQRRDGDEVYIKLS